MSDSIAQQLTSSEQPCLNSRSTKNGSKQVKSREQSYFFAQKDGCTEGTTAPERKRCYQDWKGQNTILCEGRVIGGPELCKLYRTLVLLLVPSLMFDIWVAEVFYSKYKEYNVIIMGVILPTLCALTLLKTAFTDPGIIPRKESAL